MKFWAYKTYKKNKFPFKISLLRDFKCEIKVSFDDLDSMVLSGTISTDYSKILIQNGDFIRIHAFDNILDKKDITSLKIPKNEINSVRGFYEYI